MDVALVVFELRKGGTKMDLALFPDISPDECVHFAHLF
jgi:hypothetical protein